MDNEKLITTDCLYNKQNAKFVSDTAAYQFEFTRLAANHIFKVLQYQVRQVSWRKSKLIGYTSLLRGYHRPAFSR